MEGGLITDVVVPYPSIYSVVITLLKPIVIKNEFNDFFQYQNYDVVSTRNERI